MKKRVVHIILLTALLALSVIIMGGGNDCPKACVEEGLACAMTCGGDPDGECSADLVCVTSGGGGSTGNGGSTNDGDGS